MKNEQLQTLIIELKKKDENIWKKVAKELEKPTKKRAAVNLSKIEKYVKEDEIALVPGKVLSMGTLSKKITIAAYNFSKTAKEKIEKCGCKAISIEDLMKNNKKGTKVRIII